MHKLLTLLSGLVISITGPAEAQLGRTATEAYVTNRIAAVQARVDVLSNTVSTALQPADIAGLASAASVASLSNSLESTQSTVSILSTNLTTRLFDSTGTRWIDGTGGVFQVVQTARPETQMTLTFSADFATAAGHAPAQRVHLFDDGQSGFRYLPCAGSHASPNVKWTIEVVGLWGYGIVRLKHYNEANAIDFTAICNTRNVNGNRIRPAYFGEAYGSASPYTGTIVFDDIDGFIATTNALPRVAFVSDIPSTNGLASVESVTAATAGFLSTNGNGSALTGLTASQISGLPTGGSSSTLVPIVAVTTAAVTTVTWSATPQIAYIDLYTQTTLTNSLPSLNCTSNMSVEVWINAAVTNALNPLWDARVEWSEGTPEMTCTGLYKFAFSSACGTRIQGRQTWPTMAAWSEVPFAKSATINANGSVSFLSASQTVAGYIAVHAPKILEVAVEQYSTRFIPEGGINIICGAGWSSGSTFGNPVITNNIPAWGAGTKVISKRFFVGVSNYANYVGFIIKNATTNTANEFNPAAVFVVTRSANENEILYYNAGGRDFR